MALQQTLRLTNLSLASRAGALAMVVATALSLPQSAAHAQRRSADFLFQQPLGSVTFHAGFAHAQAGSDVFSYTSDLLTLNRSDFSSMTFGIEFARSVTSRVDVFGGMSFSGNSEGSEFRDLVDQNGLPIEQDTRFSRLPIIVGGRFYLLPRGRAVGSFAWLPSALTPHVSAGAGLVWYSFRQQGDFVDVDDNEIFGANLESSGWAPLLHAGAGLDVTLSPSLILASEARYSHASVSMSEDFSDFEKIDLSGLYATVGLKIRF